MVSFVGFVSDAHRESISNTYQINEQIGIGKFSVVRRAVHKETKKEFAAKIMKKTVVKDNNLMREVEIMRQLQHPNIIALNDIYETDNELTLILELVTGGELFDKIVERVSYTEGDAAELVHTLASVVGYIHSKDIIHCDLKPENLLYSDKSDKAVIKLADFGLSQQLREGQQAKAVVGTPTYMAPEIRACVGYGKPADMWSLGVVVYILLCGFPPFDETTGYNLTFPSPEWDGISDPAKDLIGNLLIVNPNARLTAPSMLNHPWVSGRNTGKESIVSALSEMKTFNTCRHTGTMLRHKREHTSVFSIFPNLQIKPLNVNTNTTPSPPSETTRVHSYSMSALTTNSSSTISVPKSTSGNTLTSPRPPNTTKPSPRESSVSPTNSSTKIPRRGSSISETRSEENDLDDAKTMLQQLVASLQREPSEITNREWMEEREEMEKRVNQIKTQLEREREVVEQLIKENKSLNQTLELHNTEIKEYLLEKVETLTTILESGLTYTNDGNWVSISKYMKSQHAFEEICDSSPTVTYDFSKIARFLQELSAMQEILHTSLHLPPIVTTMTTNSSSNNNNNNNNYNNNNNNNNNNSTNTLFESNNSQLTTITEKEEEDIEHELKPNPQLSEDRAHREKLEKEIAKLKLELETLKKENTDLTKNNLPKSHSMHHRQEEYKSDSEGNEEEEEDVRSFTDPITGKPPHRFMLNNLARSLPTQQSTPNLLKNDLNLRNRSASGSGHDLSMGETNDTSPNEKSKGSKRRSKRFNVEDIMQYMMHAEDPKLGVIEET